jgi:hypothetical protein
LLSKTQADGVTVTEEHLSSDYATWKKWRLFEPAKKEVGYFEREFGDLPVQPGTKILELEFGSGSLLKWLSAKGADCTGAESIRPSWRQLAETASVLRIQQI